MENPNRTTLTVALVTGTGAPRRGGFAGPLAYVSCCEEQGPILFHKSEAREAVEALLQSDSLIVGHDVAFDLGVLATCWPDLVPLIFDAYRSNRVTDIMLREKLLHIGVGTFDRHELADSYSLGATASRRLEIQRLGGRSCESPGPDTWAEGLRVRAAAIRDIFQQQECNLRWFDEQYSQARTAWWLGLMQNRGLAVNPDAAEMCADSPREHPQLFAAMLASGIFDRKSGSPLVRKARGGRARDLYSIHPRFEALSSVERVTSSPDVQYLPRSGGVRECFVPRSGFVFAAASYSMFELHSAAVALRYVGITGSLGRALSEGSTQTCGWRRRCSRSATMRRFAGLRAGIPNWNMPCVWRRPPIVPSRLGCVPPASSITRSRGFGLV